MAAPDTPETAEDLEPVTATLRQIWSGVLNVASTFINTSAGSFVTMGGDSI